MSSETETKERDCKKALLRRIFASVLILMILFGIFALLWQWLLQEQPSLVQYIAVVIPILFGIYSLLIGRRLTPTEQSKLWRFITNSRNMVVLMVLATLLWGLYFGSVITDRPYVSGPQTLDNGNAPATSSGGETNVDGASKDVNRNPFTIKDICTATANFESELAAKSHLEERAWTIAAAHYGTDSNLRMVTPPQFTSGRNLAEICIEVTFRSEASGQ